MADMDEGFAPNHRVANVLRAQCRLGILPERCNCGFEGVHRLHAKWHRQRRLTQHTPVGQPHSVGRKHTAKRVDHNALHCECISDKTGVLSASAAKAGKRIARDVMPARDRDFLDRIGHIGDRNRDEALCGFLRRDCPTRHSLNLGNELSELLCYHPIIKRQITAFAKQPRKMRGLNFAQHHIAISDRQRPTAPIGCWPRHGTCRMRPNLKTPALKPAD